MKTAIITGITGQDGAYLSQLLLSKGYKVIGLTRSYVSSNLKGLDYLNIRDQVIIEECDLTDISQIIQIYRKFEPTEIYNLSAQSSVSTSFKQPIGTVQYNIISVLNQLEAIKLTNPTIKFYQASSSEMFGKVNNLPITERSVLHPLSPYAISKATAHWLCVNYRESYNLFVCCGVLFNHESYLRSDNFFIKKVLREAIQIKEGLQDVLKVGNIEIKRDFGFAPKYVEAMYLMMQHNQPDDYLICSGKSLTLRAIIESVFKKLNISTNKIVIDDNLYRPTDIEDIFGSNNKAKQVLGWDYSIEFEDVLDILLEEELRNYKK
jgi:GDPmannose 4,6-dehydratase